MCCFVDSHCHVHMSYYEQDRDEVIKRAFKKGVSIMLTIGIDAEDSVCASKLASKYDGIYFSAGFHPHDASRYDETGEHTIIGLLKHNKNVAVGEIGLDFYRNYSPRETQMEVFLKQLKLAKVYEKPVILHVRDAHEETIKILSNYCPIRGVVHCFSGDKDVLKRYLDMGLHVSFAGNATYNKNLKEVLKYVPLDRLLVETDSPFLSPLSRRGNRNEPSFVIEVYEYVSTVIGIDVVRLRDTVFANFVTLFGLNL